MPRAILPPGFDFTKTIGAYLQNIVIEPVSTIFEMLSTNNTTTINLSSSNEMAGNLGASLQLKGNAAVANPGDVVLTAGNITGPSNGRVRIIGQTKFRLEQKLGGPVHLESTNDQINIGNGATNRLAIYSDGSIDQQNFTPTAVRNGAQLRNNNSSLSTLKITSDIPITTVNRGTVEIIDTNSSNATTHNLIAAISNNNLRMRLTAGGNLSIDGTFTSGGADFAELMINQRQKEIPFGTPVVLFEDICGLPVITPFDPDFHTPRDILGISRDPSKTAIIGGCSTEEIDLSVLTCVALIGIVPILSDYLPFLPLTYRKIGKINEAMVNFIVR
jgi:hypothetical protein